MKQTIVTHLTAPSRGAAEDMVRIFGPRGDSFTFCGLTRDVTQDDEYSLGWIAKWTRDVPKEECST